MGKMRLFNLIGFLIIICGFFAIPLSNWKISPIYFFWLGFLLIFSRRQSTIKISPWRKWALLGLLLNVLGNLIELLFYIDLINPFLPKSHFISFTLSLAINRLVSPVTFLLGVVFPYKKTILHDGSVLFQFDFYRKTLEIFLDVIAYILFAVVIGKLIASKRLKGVEK